MATTNDRTIEANGSPSSLMEGTDLFMMTDSNGSFKRASVSDMVDALKKLGAVNGRNLVKRSAMSWRTNEYSMGALLWGEARPELGQQVTVTVWGELGSDRTSFVAFNSTGDGGNGVAHLEEIAPGVHSGVMTLKKWNSTNGISLYQFPNTATSVSRIDRVKVELGTIATDWTPAPEDIADLFTEIGGKIHIPNTLRFAPSVLRGEREGCSMSDRTAIATNAILKNLLTDAVVDRNSLLVDFNTCLTAGVYRYGPQTLNIPEGAGQYGIAIVFVTSVSGQIHVVQIALPDSVVDAMILVRMYWINQFRAWRTFKPSL